MDTSAWRRERVPRLDTSASRSSSLVGLPTTSTWLEVFGGWMQPLNGERAGPTAGSPRRADGRGVGLVPNSIRTRPQPGDQKRTGAMGYQWPDLEPFHVYGRFMTYTRGLAGIIGVRWHRGANVLSGWAEWPTRCRGKGSGKGESLTQATARAGFWDARHRGVAHWQHMSHPGFVLGNHDARCWLVDD